MGIVFSRRAACAHSGAYVRNAAIAALAGVCLAGCVSSGPGPSPVASGNTPTIAFDSIDGPPPGVFQRLVSNLAIEAEARQIAVVSREGGSDYRVRGYLAAQVVRGRTHVAWVWDVYDGQRTRTLRITGEEPAGRPGSDPWAVADEAMLRKIARASIDQLNALVAAPNTAMGGPYEPVPPGMPVAAALR